MSDSSSDPAAAAGPAGDPVAAFLAWLRVEKNFSPATIRAYAADLDQFARFCAGGAAPTPPPAIDPGLVTLRTVRGFLGALSAQGLKTSSRSRPLPGGIGPPEGILTGF